MDLNPEIGKLIQRASYNQTTGESVRRAIDLPESHNERLYHPAETIVDENRSNSIWALTNFPTLQGNSYW